MRRYEYSPKTKFFNNCKIFAEFEKEILGFPQARHDDQADALAQLLGWRSRSTGQGIATFSELIKR